jgi:CheY-like chemotaxis protein
MLAASPVVLLVDGHQDSLAMYAVGLLAMGFQPVTAADAQDAFQRACHLRPDVAIVDVGLPDTSGLELVRQLRGDSRTKHAVVLALSGHAVGSIRHDAIDAGCDQFLLKPVPPDDLAVTIRQALAHVACPPW